MPGDWKRDPDTRAEIATDAVVLAPTAAAAKHNASKCTAQRLADRARTPATPEQCAEYQIRAYRCLVGLHLAEGRLSRSIQSR